MALFTVTNTKAEKELPKQYDIADTTRVDGKPKTFTLVPEKGIPPIQVKPRAAK